MSPLPAGPKGKLFSTWRILKDPRAFFRDCVDRYGDPFVIHALNGPVVITGRSDLIDQVEREHLFDEIGTLLFAGHETTAIALAWAMYHLHRHPQRLAKLRDELAGAPDDSPSTLSSLPLLKAIIQETLRLNPIVTEVLRKLKTPFTLGEYQIPTGYAIAPAAVLAHYDPHNFADPESFNPDRFITQKYTPSQYLPFGGGKRRCVGAAFSMYEMAIVLGTLLHRYEFELLETTPVVPTRRNVTMGPSTGVRLRFLGRRDVEV